MLRKLPTRSNSMILYILIVLAATIVIILLAATQQPAEFSVSRNAVISAPLITVFGYLNDLHRWQEFSPWAKMDPNMKITFEGPASGVGAAFKWEGNAKIGQGSMTITESWPNELVRYKLEFVKPMKATNTTEFTIRPDGGQTYVTWTMTGKKNFTAKLMHMFMNMDKMISGQFDKGLKTLKSLCESPDRPPDRKAYMTHFLAR